jgi:hypothetical protein
LCKISTYKKRITLLIVEISGAIVDGIILNRISDSINYFRLAIEVTLTNVYGGANEIGGLGIGLGQRLIKNIINSSLEIGSVTSKSVLLNRTVLDGDVISVESSIT